MSRVNIVKRVKIDGRWKMLYISRNAKGNLDRGVGWMDVCINGQQCAAGST